MRRDAFARIVGVVTRRPLLVLTITALLALGGAALALRLEPSAATETLVDQGSDSFQATERFKQDFGDEAVLVLVRGKLSNTVLTDDLGRMLSLEGCLGGNIAPDDLRRELARHRRNPQRGLPPVCGEIADLRPAKVVFGPGTFINTSVNEIVEEYGRRQQVNQRQAEQAAEAARKLSKRRGDPPAEQERLAEAAFNAVGAQFVQQMIALGLRYGIADVPRIDDPGFVSRLVFGTTTDQPKSRFAYLFPSSNAAMITIRLRPGLGDEERRRAIDLIRTATEERVFQPRRGAEYIVTGVPVVSEGLAEAVQDAIFVLLGAALLVMAATLALVFRSRLRLLPLLLALAAAAMTFGALYLAGGDLTMASIAVLPVLIGLAVDYAIQFQARFDEQAARGRTRIRAHPAEPGASGWGADAATAAASAGGPTILSAGIATSVGFLVLLLSPVPMVRGFGALLVVGIGLALLCSLCAGFAALARFGGSAAERGRPAGPGSARRGPLRGVTGRLGAYTQVANAREWLADRAWRSLGVALTRPRRVLAIGLAVAVVGLALDTQSEVVSDVRELVPQDLQELRDVNVLQEETGVSGEIDVTVRADDITDPEVIAWMTRFQAGVLREHGYRPGKRCTQERDPPELCPALSLPDLFSTSGTQQGQVRELLDAVPAYFSQGVVTPDRRTANLAFGIRLMPLDRQEEVVEDIKDRLDPPEGVEASVVGLPVLAAEANGALASPWRRGLTLLAALGGVLLVLLLVRRSLRTAAVPLIPIALATGWSAGVLFLLGLLPGSLEVDLNPMSVTLGALVIAISTEFSVLLSSRYLQERAAGAGPARAIELTYASTGAAVLASGATAIAGFAALIASDIRMLRDFGIVTVVDLTVSLLGVMIVLPAALMWAEEHGSFRVPRPRLRGLRPRRAQTDTS
ncbi:MAG TPA: MMPL family transporter [Thermoleophilaceae bacterium]|nr:MMPL family transporter [Thermoleophilaceae bacterium]